MREGEYYSVDIGVSDLAGRSSFGDSDTQYIEPPLERERKFLQKLGFAKPFLEILVSRARENATTLEAELLADGRVREDAYYGALARVLGLPFLAKIDPATITDKFGIDIQLRQPRLLRCHLADRAPALAMVPSAREILDETACIVSRAGVRERIAVTTPSAIRQAVWTAGASRRVDQAANALFDAAPEYSARIVFSGAQGFLAGLTLTLLGLSFLLAPASALLAIHIFLSLAYFLSLIFRGFAIHFGPWLTQPKRLKPAGVLPVYTVLVALYQEEAVLPQLIGRLNRLQWPRSRLDIKLVCEARDAGTIDVLKAMNLGPEYEIVVVPDMQPRTKPKALNYGLAAARGDYLVIYDAEDRPHAEQLLEAWQHFQAAPEHVACLQGPLVVPNIRDGWLPALFALEYAGLFRRILPLLGAVHLPMPLGGTSNHFRTAILRAAGGWDAYNVTEDADLGHRLYRLGYRSEMITRPTLEDAPTEAGVWLGQRTRWFKGWMQTWLVLMREPRRLTAELGIAGTIAFHAMITGMLVSALGHPLIIGFLTISAWHLVHSVYTTPMEQVLFILDGIDTFGAYTLFVTMGRKAMIPEERRRFGAKWRWVPAYWLMISYAAWKAVVELNTNPFFWKKTPHKASRHS
jgi:cellulose synthase/poly-beta-1,6-N-acetylglucosamine synthase-like glycosyltransferase